MEMSDCRDTDETLAFKGIGRQKINISMWIFTFKKAIDEGYLISRLRFCLLQNPRLFTDLITRPFIS